MAVMAGVWGVHSDPCEDMTLGNGRNMEGRSITFNAADYNEGTEWVKTKTPSKQRRFTTREATVIRGLVF